MPVLDLKSSGEILYLFNYLFCQSTSETFTSVPLFSHLTSDCGGNHWKCNNLKPPIKHKGYNLKIEGGLHTEMSFLGARLRTADGRNWIARVVRGYIC